MEQMVNIGRNERRIRVGMGFLLIGIGGLTATPEWVSFSFFGLAATAIYTGIRQFCPLWHALGINTRKHDPLEHH